MEKHKAKCCKAVTTMPTAENAIIEFLGHHRQMDLPFCIYADFECVLEADQTRVSDTTRYIQKHMPCSDKNLRRFKIYISRDATENL